LVPTEQTLWWSIFPQEAAFIGASFLAWIVFEKRPLRKMGLAPASFLSFAIGAGIGIMMIGTLFLLLWPSPWLEVTDVRWNKAVLLSVLSAVSGFLAVAAGEEIFTRGYVQTLLVERLGVWGGIIATSLLFSLLHLLNPHTSLLPMFNLFLAGVLLGVIKEATGSLWMPIGLHFTWNLTQELLSLPVSGVRMASAPPVNAVENGPDWLTGGPFGLEGGIAVTLMLLLVILWFVRRDPVRFRFKGVLSAAKPLR
jgi:membrane protease YdiL (CAAX protease family)